MRHDHRADAHPLARRGQPRPRQGHRRLPRVGSGARHERLHLHRSRHRIHGCGRRGRPVRCRRRDVRAPARRRPGSRPDDDRGRREVRGRHGVRQAGARLRRTPDGLRPPGLPRRGPPRPHVAPHRPRAQRTASRGGRGARAGCPQGAPRASSRPRARDQRGVLGRHRPRLRRDPAEDVHRHVHLRAHRRLERPHPRAEAHRTPHPPVVDLHRTQGAEGRRDRGLESRLGRHD